MLFKGKGILFVYQIEPVPFCIRGKLCWSRVEYRPPYSVMSIKDLDLYLALLPTINILLASASAADFDKIFARLIVIGQVEIHCLFYCVSN